jgi:pimeloyl-ACP methyl ester carboxylesterase
MMFQVVRTVAVVSLALFLFPIMVSGQERIEAGAVQVYDIEMHYETRGSGSPLVLLHEFGGCSGNWHPFTDALSRSYRLINVDLRGHGASTNPQGTFTHRQSARDVFALLDSLGVHRFKAMGISAGGMTLLHMATEQPDRIDAMVLIGAAPYLPEATRAIQRQVSVENMPPEARELHERCATRGEEQIQQLVSQFSSFHASYDDVTFTPPYLATIAARTMVVHGDRDPFFPVELAVEMYRAIPEASLWIIPHGGHVPIYDPSVPFAARALRFLDGSGPR